MKNNTPRKTVNVDKPNLRTLWSFKDSDDAVLNLSLFKESVPFDITGQTIRLGAKTNSGLKEQIDGFTIQGNNLDIALKNTILVPGVVEIDLEFTDVEGKMTSASFFINVSSKVLNNTAVEATNEFSTFKKTVDEITTDYEGLRKIVIDENNAANLQDQVNTVNAHLAEINNKADAIDTNKRDKSVKIPATEFDTSSNASKIKLINLSDEVIQSMSGNAPVNNVIENNSVTKEKIADQAIDFNKINISFLRADIVSGNIEINTSSKTITYTNLTVVSSQQNRNITANSISYTGTLFNLFLDSVNNKLVSLPWSDFTSYPSNKNTLYLIATFYNNGLYNVYNKTPFTINGVEVLNKPSMSYSNVNFYTGTSYGGYKGITSVTFDEYNKNITFPKNGNIVIGNVSNILADDIILPVTKGLYTLVFQMRIYFDNVTKEIKLKALSGGANYTFPLNEIPLGSFLLEWDGEYPVFKNIQGCFAFNHIKKIEPVKAIQSYWNDKVANFLGDSITQGSYGNYVNVVKDILGLSVANNYGIGGSRLCVTGNPAIDDAYTPLIRRYQNIDMTADIVFVLIGTNDYSSQVPLGASSSVNEMEFNGALNIMMDWFRTNFPDKLVIFSTLLHRLRETDPEKPIVPNMYRDAIRERCEAKHFVCYDAYLNTGFDFSKSYYDKVLSSDGLHPNQRGAEILGRKIAGFINAQ